MDESGKSDDSPLASFPPLFFKRETHFEEQPGIKELGYHNTLGME